MFRLIRLFNTSIGRKLLMAASGLVLIAFLVGHMLGNMTIYQGQDSLNSYAAWLQGHPLLWIIRLVMLSVLGVHLYFGIRITLRNRAARPKRNVRSVNIQSSVAARVMIWSGLLALAFLVYHVLHLTLGAVGVTGLMDNQGRPDIYSRVVIGFRDPLIAATYVLAIALIGLHLNHATRSLFQTLGYSHQGYQFLIHFFASVLSVLLVVGFSSIPVCVQLGLIHLPVTVGP